MARLEYQIVGDSSGLTTAIKSATTGLNALDVSVKNSSKSIQNEISSIIDLQKQLKNLNANKLNIVDKQELAKQNALIQELEAEIKRATNVGKIGFDESGVAIKGFGRSLQDATDGANGFGGSLRSGFGTLRQLAFILPGIGIAGIFNLAFEGIAKATEGLDLFSSKVTVAQSNLANINEVAKNASKQFGEQSESLKILYTATQDVTLSEKDRLLAAQELQKEFPALFGNIKTETILNGGAADAYRDATQAILDNAKAKAAFTKISELAGKQLESEFQIQKILNAQSNELARVKAPEVFQNTGGSSLTGTSTVEQVTTVTIAQQKRLIQDRANAALKIQDQNKKDLQAQIDFLIAFAGGNNKIAAALSSGEKIKPSKDTTNTFEELSKQLDEIFKKSTDTFNESGLKGYALEVQKITDKFNDLDNAVQSVLNKSQRDLQKGKITPDQFAIVQSKAQIDFDANEDARQKELANAKINEAQRVANEIQRINDEFGVRSEQSREKEIAQIQLRYDKEIKLADGNSQLIAVIQADRITAIAAINEKYLQIEQDLWDKIGLIDQQAQSEIGDKTAVETAKIQKEWETRRQAADKYYQQLLLILQSELKIADGITGLNISGLVTKAVQQKQAATGTAIDAAKQGGINLAVNRNQLSALQSATSGFIGDFLNGLENANSQIGADFESVFAGIASSFQKTMESVIVSTVGKLLQEQLEKGIKNGTINLSGQLQGALAAAGIAGSLISGITPKTSIIGQGLGGALSGAASGALVGSLFGPAGTIAGGVIGGTIGLLGGIFGASKAQKELQQQQLEQQKEQTAALKASLAYTSTILGRMTTQGIITGVDVGAQGQLVATVSGKQLQFVLDRSSNGR